MLGGWFSPVILVSFNKNILLKFEWNIHNESNQNSVEYFYIIIVYVLVWGMEQIFRIFAYVVLISIETKSRNVGTRLQ